MMMGYFRHTGTINSIFHIIFSYERKQYFMMTGCENSDVLSGENKKIKLKYAINNALGRKVEKNFYYCFKSCLI